MSRNGLILIMGIALLLMVASTQVGGSGAYFSVTETATATFQTGVWWLPPAPNIVSCDGNGNERTQFAPGEGVYVKASGLEGSSAYKIWVQDEPVAEGDTLVLGENPSAETPKLVTTQPDGSLQATLIWQIPASAAVTYHEYDIVFDKQSNGDNTGKYNASSDGIDSTSVVGFVAPVPELPTIIMLSMGLAGLAGWLVLRRRRTSVVSQ